MSLSMAMILLAPKAKLSAAAIKADLARKWPDVPDAERTEAKEGQIVFRIGNDDVVIALMPAPIPWSDLEGPCQTSWMWPDAKMELKAHAAHLIVTVLSEDGPVERARLMTQVCASILATCAEAPGVFWTDAALLIPSKLFQEFTKEILPVGPPLYLWVDFRVGPAEKGKSSGFTTGLTTLGHMEFEAEDTPEPPGELRERFFGLGNYVLENGPVINDGDTIGEDANERIRVVYSNSAFGQKGKVMRLEYTRPEKRKSWFGRG